MVHANKYIAPGHWQSYDSGNYVAKILVEDTEDQTRIPFLRGILIRSLQDAGVPFGDAFTLASEIRNELADKTLVTTTELQGMVVSHLRAIGKDSVVSRYEKPGILLLTQVEQRDGQLIPFSRLEYQHCLETIGLESDEAERVVQTLQQHMADRHIEKITSRRLAQLTYRYLRQSQDMGPAVAHRWLVWRDFVNSGRELILLIGGTAGCGKSTVATMLASRLDIVRTQSTDMLREVMRTMIPSKLMPVLHESSFTAWQALPGQPRNIGEVSDALLIHGYRSQADLLSVATEAVIQRAMRERVSLILEGVHIHPAFMEKLQSDADAVVIPIMLGVLKRKQLQRRIQGRGSNAPRRRAKRYLEHFDEIWRLQSYLLSEADRANIDIVLNSNRDKVFREIMRITINKLAEDFDSTAEQVFA
jgi:2-phosphoglycerate kinase